MLKHLRAALIIFLLAVCLKNISGQVVITGYSENFIFNTTLAQKVTITAVSDYFTINTIPKIVYPVTAVSKNFSFNTQLTQATLISAVSDFFTFNTEISHVRIIAFSELFSLNTSFQQYRNITAYSELFKFDTSFGDLILGYSPLFPLDFRTYNLSFRIMPARGGTAYGGGSYLKGRSVFLEANPNEGFHFLRWTDSHEEVVSMASRFSYTMPGESTVLTAHFSGMSLPLLTTGNPYNVGSNNAKIGGSILDEGDSDVKAKGVVWATTPGPTLDQHEGMTMDGSGTGHFISSLEGLLSNTVYYVRAYATNESGTGYGDEKSFLTAPSVFTMSGGGSYCRGTHPTGINVELNQSEPGIIYELFKNGFSTGKVKDGTGQHLVWPDLGKGTYIIKALNDSAFSWMQGHIIINETAPIEIISIQADFPVLCVGNDARLSAQVRGGSGNFKYHWTSEPAGFNSFEENPLVIPSQNTTYYLTVSDACSSTTGQKDIIVFEQPFHSVFSAHKIDFGTTFTGNMPGNTVTITNQGCDTLEYSLTVKSPFLLSPSEFKILPAHTQEVTVYFYPNETGYFEEQVDIVTNAENAEELYIAVTGTARTPNVDLSIPGPISVTPSIPNTKDDITLYFNILLEGEKGFEGIQYSVKNLLTGEIQVFTIRDFIAAGSTHPVQFSLPGLQPPGIQHWLVKLDPNNLIAETNEDNNQAEIEFQVVTAPKLVCKEVILSSDKVHLGEAVDVAARFHNYGESYASAVKYLIKAVDKFGSEHIVESGNIDVPGLTSVTIESTYTPYTYPGRVQIIALIYSDDIYSESDETNNTSANNLMAILPIPYLTIGGSNILNMGEPQTYTITIFNGGMVTLSNLNTEVILPEIIHVIKSNSQLTEGNTLYWNLDKLAPGESKTISMELLFHEGSEGSGSIINIRAITDYHYHGYAYNTEVDRSIQLGLDTWPPRLNLFLPSHHLTLQDTEIILEANESLQESPEFFITREENDTLLKGSFVGAADSWTATLSPQSEWVEGHYTLHASCFDLAGNFSATSVDFILDLSPPVLNVSHPSVVSYAPFEFRITSNELLQKAPEVSISYNNTEEILPVLKSQQGLTYWYIATIPTDAMPEEIYIQVQITDMAGYESNYEQYIPTDFLPPVLTHDLPHIVETTFIEAIITSNKILESTPIIWVTDNKGKSINYDGPIAVDEKNYKVFLHTTLPGYAGKITLVCLASDLAGNISLMTHEMAVDNQKPEITIVSDPPVPSGNFSVKLFTSEPLSYPFDIHFYGNTPGQLINAPVPIIHSDHYEYQFVNTHLSKISVSASDTMNNIGTAQRIFTDLEATKIPFRFLGTPNGVKDCTVKVSVANLTGVPVDNIPVILLNYNDKSTEQIGDTLNVSLAPFETTFVDFNWPAKQQFGNLNLQAIINPGEVFPELNYFNNKSTYRRLYLSKKINKPAFEKTIDTLGVIELRAYSGRNQEPLGPGDISTSLNIYHSESEDLIFNEVEYIYSEGRFIFHIPISVIENTGNYHAVIYADDHSGLDIITDTIRFYLSEPFLISVSTNKKVYNRQETVEITGNINFADNILVSDHDILVFIHSQHGTREYELVTNDSGSFELLFEPFWREAGDYYVTSIVNYNGIVKEATCDFEMYGLLATPVILNNKISRNSSISGVFKLENIGSVSLKNLNAKVLPRGYPENIEVILGDLPAIIDADEHLTVPYQINSGTGGSYSAIFDILISADAGEEEVITLQVETSEAVPQVFSFSDNNEFIIRPGENKVVSIDFLNSGFAPAYHPEIVLPDIDFIQVFNPPSIDQINIDDTLSYKILITPDDSIAEGLYSGFVVLNSDNAEASQALLSIYITNHDKGNLQITAESSLGKIVPNASVHIYSQKYDFYEQSYPVFSGETDAAGNVYFENILSGVYHFQVEAEQHNKRSGSVIVKPVIQTKSTKQNFQKELLVLDFNPISYGWSVEEITLEDEYLIQLIAEITPMDSITPPYIITERVGHNLGNKPIKTGTFEIYNGGDITVYDIRPKQDTVSIGDDYYEFRIKNVERLFSLGLGRKHRSFIQYEVEKLFYTHDKNRIRHYPVWFEGKYLWDGKEQPIEFFVLVDLTSDASCLTISPPIERHIRGNNKISRMTRNVWLGNHTHLGPTEFTGGGGLFLFEYGLSIRSLIMNLILGGAGLAGEVFENALRFYNLFDLLDKASSGDWDVSIGAETVEPNSSKSAEVVWKDFKSVSDDLFKVQFGLLPYNYKCYADDSFKIGLLPIYQSYFRWHINKWQHGIPLLVPKITGEGEHIYHPPGTWQNNVSQVSDQKINKIIMHLDQELTTERQAFNIRLNLSNDTPQPVENFKIKIITKDQFGNIIAADQTSTACPFFFQQPILSNIEDIDGRGTIAPYDNASMQWLVIPKVGSGDKNGKVYQFQGHISFTVDGKEIDIYTDHTRLTVNPMPILDIDYYLPEYFRENIEFYLSLAISNNGYGTAHNVRLTSGQPVLECFAGGRQVPCTNYHISINGGYLQNQYQSHSMEIDFGNISPGETKVGYWELLADFSGLINKFDATFEHSELLGGKSTSIINSINTSIFYRLLKIHNHNKAGDYLGFIVIDSTSDNYPDLVLDAGTGIRHPLQVLSPNVERPPYFNDNYLNLSFDNISGWGYFSVQLNNAKGRILSGITNSSGYRLNNSQYWIEGSTVHVVDNMIEDAHYTLSFSEPINTDLAIFQDLLSYRPIAPIVGEAIEFQIEVYNGGNVESETTALHLFKVEASDSIVFIDEFLVDQILPGKTIVINDIISPDILELGINIFRFILDPDSLINDQNRKNNILDFEVRVSMDDSCLIPEGLNVTFVSDTNALLEWISFGNELEWDILYGFSGFNPENEGAMIRSVTNIPYNLENLLRDTVYDFYIRAQCDFGSSGWGGPFSFGTLACAPDWELMQNLPYSMQVIFNFDSMEGVALNSGDFIGAFVNGQCRGMAYVNNHDNSIMKIIIGSNVVEGEKVDFKVWIYSECQEYQLLENVIFQDKTEIGTEENPFTFNLRDATGLIQLKPEAKYVIGEPYPNPFTDQTEIPFWLSVEAMVSIGIYDMMGRQLNDITSIHYDSGYQKILFYRDNLKPGIYFLRMEIVLSNDLTGQKVVRLILHN